MVSDISVLFSKGDYEASRKLGSKVEKMLEDNSISDKLLLSDYYFSIGLTYYFINKYTEACEKLMISSRYREEAGIKDVRYTNCINNIGLSYYSLGEYSNALKYGKMALEVKRQVFGIDSAKLVSNYVNLASIKLQLSDYDESIAYAEAGLLIANLYPDEVNSSEVSALYQDIAWCLSFKGENAKALSYATQALPLCDPDIGAQVNSWNSMIQLLTKISIALKEPEKAAEYYRLGLSKITSKNISFAYQMFNSYATFLYKRNQFADAEKIFLQALGRINIGPGINSREYAILTTSYASFIYLKNKDVSEATKYFNQCFEYLKSHSWDIETKEYVISEYGRMLFDAKRYRLAIDVFNEILVPVEKSYVPGDHILNKDERLSQNMIESLSMKYQSLNALAKETGSRNYTLEAIKSGELLISVFDRDRLDMSEDESRTNLSDTSRVFCTWLIENYCSLYDSEKDPALLAKAFEFSEKSKVSGFLAATRQLNATRFSVPDDQAKIENDLRKKIGLYSEFIEKEKISENPDSIKIAILERDKFNLIRSRDSMDLIFEKKYPDFYKLKYKSGTTSINDVTTITGSGENLLSYILTDDKLFIFVINKLHKEVIVKRVDSGFHNQLARFREIISAIPAGTNAHASFNEYMFLANELYKSLIEPVEPLLISDRLMISPDNILSYIPFESLITKTYYSEDLLYRDAPYVLKKYRISYIYSVTLSSETRELSLHFRNRAIAFAPSYAGREIPDSLLNLYPNLRGSISNLPYAAMEVENAVRQCGGVAYIGESATEDAYKNEASKFNIIHMAMHTLVNDEDPSYSKMIFSQSLSSGDDGLLNTYEVYNVPLDARMVVLSSCNTGSGKLTSGEGIQSLARGFIFSGAHSVVMSMWEVEDYAGSEVVKLFYRNIIKGRSKSQALRQARLKFLEVADQKRSHPYYWSTLVIYGDNSPLYLGKIRLAGALLALSIALLLVLFLFYKGPKS